MPLSQAVEEPVKQLRGLRPLQQFCTTEAIYLVPTQPQLAVLGGHVGVAMWTCPSVVVGIVLCQRSGNLNPA